MFFYLILHFLMKMNASFICVKQAHFVNTDNIIFIETLECDFLNLEYYDSSEQDACLQLGDAIIEKIKENVSAEQEVVILCIGTDRATGDCLGPLVGNHLQNELHTIHVFGTLEHPIHALNLHETIEFIHNAHINPYIIAVDASLGIHEHIGLITLSSEALRPGKGVNKKLPAIGNLAITGIVNISGFPNSILLQSTRLHIVMVLANCIASALCYAFENSQIIDFPPYYELENQL